MNTTTTTDTTREPDLDPAACDICGELNGHKDDCPDRDGDVEECVGCDRQRLVDDDGVCDECLPHAAEVLEELADDAGTVAS